jgi:hypothetical protein
LSSWWIIIFCQNDWIFESIHLQHSTIYFIGHTSFNMSVYASMQQWCHTFVIWSWKLCTQFLYY